MGVQYSEHKKPTATPHRLPKAPHCPQSHQVTTMEMGWSKHEAAGMGASEIYLNYGTKHLYLGMFTLTAVIQITLVIREGYSEAQVA